MEEGREKRSGGDVDEIRGRRGGRKQRRRKMRDRRRVEEEDSQEVKKID